METPEGTGPRPKADSTSGAQPKSTLTNQAQNTFLRTQARQCFYRTSTQETLPPSEQEGLKTESVLTPLKSSSCTLEEQFVHVHPLLCSAGHKMLSV